MSDTAATRVRPDPEHADRIQAAVADLVEAVKDARAAGLEVWLEAEGGEEHGSAFEIEFEVRRRIHPERKVDR